jgi:hypothetical protein
MARQSRRTEVEPLPEPARSSLFDTVALWLDANDWTYTRNTEYQWFSSRYQGDHGEWRLVFDTNESETMCRLLIYSVYPIRVPLLRRAAVADFLARINFGMVIGDFVFDLSDGEVRMKTAADVITGPFPDAQIDRLLRINLGAANQYLAPLLAVAFGDLSPEKAATLAEEKPDGPLQ